MAINYRKVASSYTTIEQGESGNITTVPTLLWSFTIQANQTTADIDMTFLDGSGGSILLQTVVGPGAGSPNVYPNCEGLYFPHGLSFDETTTPSTPADALGSMTVIYETMAAPATGA